MCKSKGSILSDLLPLAGDLYLCADCGSKLTPEELIKIQIQSDLLKMDYELESRKKSKRYKK
jgi:hypothetical protein